MKELQKFVEVSDTRLTSQYTRVLMDNEFICGAPHSFIVQEKEMKTPVTVVHFQEGPVKEAGVNGCFHEDILIMVLKRLRYFQNGPYACKENEEAIVNIEAALDAMRRRTNDRKERNVLGTYEK